jgi:diguanylate cyclase (GGDEF)-like protein
MNNQTISLNYPVVTVKNVSYYAQILLISSELFLIVLLSYAAKEYLPAQTGQYISLDMLYCLPIIQTARLASIHALHHSDSQTSTIAGIAVALVWSATEATTIGSGFPLNAFLLNAFTRSVVFTVLGRVVLKLWREKEFAHKDALTGLANRRELLNRLEIEQTRSERSANPYSVLYFDVDKFKSLNDSQGHHVGDEALKVVADILQRSSRAADVAARLGGDEFVLLLPDTNKALCDDLIKRIESSMTRSFAERLWPISVSIGQATKIGKTQKLDWVIQLADENMYEVKKRKQQILNDVNGERSR